MKIYPSNLDMLDRCPGYQSSPFDSAQSTEGKVLHSAMEGQDPDDLDADQAALTATCRELLVGYVTAARTLDYPAKIEAPFRIITKSSAGDDIVISGKKDWCGSTNNGAMRLVVDYKFGRRPIVPVPDNLQGITYGLSEADLPRAEFVTVFFLCPRIELQPLVQSATWSVEELKRIWEARVHPLIELVVRAQDDKSLWRYDEYACKYCARKAGCPVYEEIVQSSVPMLPNAPVFTDEEIKTLKRGDLCGPELIAKRQMVASLLGDWCKEAKRYHAQLVVDGGMDIPGFNLQRRAGESKFNSIDGVMNTLASLGFREEQLRPAMSLSVSRLLSLPSLTPDQRNTLLPRVLAPFIQTAPEIVYLRRAGGNQKRKLEAEKTDKPHKKIK